MCYAQGMSAGGYDHSSVSTYTNQEIRIIAMEVLDLEYTRQRLLVREWRIQLLAEPLLHTQGLKNKDTHPNDALLGQVILGLDGIIQYQDHEVSGPICIDEVASEAFIAL